MIIEIVLVNIRFDKSLAMGNLLPLALRSLGASEAEMELALPLVLWFLLELAIAATAYDFPDLPL